MDLSATNIKTRIWDRIKDSFYFQRANNPICVRNINYNSSMVQPRILICYLETGYFTNVEINIKRTIIFEIFRIVKVFSELGFCIDVINCNDFQALELVADTRYHTVFGFGEAFYRITKQQPGAISILYMTENHPALSFAEEKKRTDYFHDRHQKIVNLNRSGKFYKPIHLETRYSHLIALGETEPFKGQYRNPYTIFPTGIINKEFEFKIKNHLAARNNFLWLGSNGAIHKGLDILMDVFGQRTDITLHVCGMSEQDKKLLPIHPHANIIEYGHININSAVFLKLVNDCTYIILPSCSEGFATSITTGMLHGLIPVVMRNTGFNRLAEHAIFLDDFKIEYVDKQLTMLSQTPADVLKIFCEKVYGFANQNFTINAFEYRFKAILSDIYGTVN